MSEKTLDDDKLSALLGNWLPRHLDGCDEVSIVDLHRSSAAGFSAETVFFTALCKGPDGEQRLPLVLRIQIRGHDLLHDADLDFQWSVMGALQEYGRLPVRTPRVIGLEKDASLLGAPFLVMDKLPGRIVPQHPNYNVQGWLHDLSLDDRRRVWANGLKAMAAVHQIDWRDGFQALSRGKEPGLSGFLDWISDWAQWAVAGRDFPVIAAALHYLRLNMPADPPINVLWGDPIPANILYDDDGNAEGLIDWELAGLGPAEIDLAWWMLFDDLFSSGMHVPRLEGLPSRDETLAIYAEALGRPVANLDYYEVLTWLRMTLVSLRAVDRQVAMGSFRGDSNAWSNNPSAAGLAKRIGHPAIEVGPDFFEFVSKLMARD